MASAEITKLKVLLKESEYPQFSDEELNMFLIENDGDVYLTASELCYLKADGDKKITIGPITIENPGADFWTALAIRYKAKSVELKQSNSGFSDGLSSGRMRRADDIPCRRR